jgi:hypothetical protein
MDRDHGLNGCDCCGCSQGSHEGEGLEAYVIRGRCETSRRIRAGERLPCAACGEGDVGMTPCTACKTNAADSGMVPYSVLGLTPPRPLFKEWCGFLND